MTFDPSAPSPPPPPMRHSLGKVVGTASVAAAVLHQLSFGLLDRHAARDWGDLDAEYKATNDSEHSHAEVRLISSYDITKNGTIWVITEDLRGGCLRAHPEG